MGLIDEFKNRYFPEKKKIELAPAPKEVKLEEKTLAVKGGRESMPEHTTVYGNIIKDKTLIAADTPVQLLDTILHLAKYNADVSYAVENIVTLCDTPEDIEFDDSVSEEMASRLLQQIRTNGKDWYNGGISALRTDLFAQIAIFGCVSIETIVKEDLSGVKRVVLVNPRNIEFGYDKKKNTYIPFQRVTNGLSVANSLIELNTNTYNYTAVRRFSEKPYAVPPFLSALESIAIEKDMLCGFKNVIKKMGVLGFLQALVEKPKQQPGENTAAYQIRCSNYLTSIMGELEHGVTSGIVAGFKDIHDFKVEGNNINVAGAKELFNLIEELKMSGLKQDPRMLGRNFSTTETYGEVIMKKFSQQLSSYQRVVDEAISKVYYMESLMSGYKINYINAKSQKPMLTDELNDVTAYAKKYEVNKGLYESGLINMQQFAQAMGFDKPDQDGPRTADSSTMKNEITLAIDDINSIDGRICDNEYDYGTECDCHADQLSFDSTGSDELDELINKYFSAVQLGYRGGIKKISQEVGKKLAMLGNGATERQVTDSILHALYTNWNTAFSSRQEAVISKWVSEIHKVFRGNTVFVAGLPGFNPAKPPQPVLTFLDMRVQDFYKRSDKLYLGKFITDEDTRKRLQLFIKEQYIGRGMPIGNDLNSSGMNLFRESFENLLKGEEWKISRIINTTANKMRNTAGLMYMKDSAATKYTILGVQDKKQCAWCSSLQGKVFSIDTGVRKIEQLVSSNPADLKYIDPFFTSQYTPAEIDKLDQAELDKMGLIVPMHANCRDQVVALL